MTHAKILLVDDDELQLDMLEVQLSSLGWDNIVLASSGEQALTEFARHGNSIEVIISDLSMPDMDGLVLMRHLAQRGFSASFILLSGMHDEILSSAAGLAHAHHLDLLGFLSKPCELDTLGKLLARHHYGGLHQRSEIEEKALTPHRLSLALQQGEFVPWYQPKVEIGSGLTVSAEALARWPNASTGMIGPARFVPAIEAAQLADVLFFCILDHVLADLVVLRKQQCNIKAAINMSMDTALNLTLPEKLWDRVCGCGLSASDLIIEVTESKLMVDRSVAMETLTRLSLMGFVLSIDDFGTGYSSLTQLVDLPFGELKVDGSFVQRASAERKAQAVVRISTLAGHSLGMDVVAEGVETQDQLDFLRTCGNLVVQGYLLARPMPFDQLLAWLQKGAVSMKPFANSA
jgi:EAL domain-containing protein (putative c-di-GMP-specific phosphodiesterase class I)/ActR/RegA family two-component response regulator